MASFIVMEPASERRGEAALFIRDAFAPLAVFVPVPWLLWNRLWFEAALALCASLFLAALAAWLGMPQLAGIASILLGLYVALEGSALRIDAARRCGFEEAAIIDAANMTEAEERYYHLSPLVPKAVAPAAAAPSVLRRTSTPDSGLFPLPGTQ